MTDVLKLILGVVASLFGSRENLEAENLVLRQQINVVRRRTTDWPYAVIDFYLGRSSMNEMLSAAAKPEEQCQVQFYLGEWHLLQDKRADAETAWRSAVDGCPKTLAEYTGALAELKLLNP